MTSATLPGPRDGFSGHSRRPATRRQCHMAACDSLAFRRFTVPSSLAPKICSTFVKSSEVGSLIAYLDITIIRIRRFENSSAIDRGTVPELKSDEFLDLRILVIEIWSILSVKPPKKVLHLLGARLSLNSQLVNCLVISQLTTC